MAAEPAPTRDLNQLDEALHSLAGMAEFISHWIDESVTRMNAGDVCGAVSALDSLDRILTRMVEIYRNQVQTNDPRPAPLP